MVNQGVLNALHDNVTVTQQRTPRRQPTFVCCFFNAETAYDSVPHDLLLYRLLQKGVSGNAFRLIDRMYAAASSRVRVDGGCSAAFPVRRGVAKGCPLSPLLCAIFVDSVLADLYAAAPPGVIQVGNAEWSQPWRGHLYADNLSTAADTARGPTAGH